MNTTFRNKEASFTQTPIPYPTLFSITTRINFSVARPFNIALLDAAVFTSDAAILSIKCSIHFLLSPVTATLRLPVFLDSLSTLRDTLLHGLETSAIGQTTRLIVQQNLVEKPVRLTMSHTSASRPGMAIAKRYTLSM
jgi:hypothetical protein